MEEKESLFKKEFASCITNNNHEKTIQMLEQILSFIFVDVDVGGLVPLVAQV
jgi:hypothetical protein